MDASSFLRGNGWASPGARVTGGLSPPMRGGGEGPRWRNPRRTWVENLTTLGPTSPPDARRLRFSGRGWSLWVGRRFSGALKPILRGQKSGGRRDFRAFPPLSPRIMPVSFLGAPRTLYVPPSIHWRAAPAVSALVYRLTISADFHRPWRMVVSVGAPAPLIIRASPTLPLWPEKTSPSKPRGSAGRILDPVGHLADREPEHPVSIPRVLRPDGVQDPKAGRGDGHHGALALLVGL